MLQVCLGLYSRGRSTQKFGCFSTIGIMRSMFTLKFRPALMLALTIGSTGALAAKPGTAVGSAKEDDWAPLPAPITMTLEQKSSLRSVPDAALMRAVMWAFEPAPVEIRRQAVEDLGLLGDPRALNVLAQFALDPNPVFAKAGVRAVALMRHPRAEEILCNVIRHPTLSEDLKIFAIGLLPMQNTESSSRFLQHVVSGPFAWALQGAARTALGELPRRSGL